MPAAFCVTKLFNLPYNHDVIAMSTAAILSFPSADSIREFPVLLQRNAGDVARPSSSTDTPTQVFILADTWGDDIELLLAELSRQGYQWTRRNLTEARSAEEPTHSSDILDLLRRRLGARRDATVISVESPHAPFGRRQQLLEFADLSLDWRRHEVRVCDQVVEFSKTEFELLFLLASNEGAVLTRREMVEGCRGGAYPVTDRSVDVQMVGVRRKLGAVRNYLQTVRGVGYRFDSDRRGARPR